MKSWIYYHCSKWYSGKGWWECCAKLLSKPKQKTHRQTRMKKFFKGCRCWWRSRLSFMYFFQGWEGTDDGEIVCLWISEKCEFHMHVGQGRCTSLNLSSVIICCYKWVWPSALILILKRKRVSAFLRCVICSLCVIH